MGFTSLAMIAEAPAAFAIPTAKMPIGPQPVTSTVAPGSCVPWSAVWKAFPIGSWIPPTAKLTAGSRCQTLLAGIAM